ncbi:response regulator [Actinoplanes sp. G11-F43]|uniref:response regulator n=1 Tax=Actinoplanes sp. G11-F43 TaxID=3424130 RepID=UPI003D353FA2
MSVRVVLADDQPLIRRGLRVLIDSTEDLMVVGEAGDGVETVRLVREQRPDVVVMDIRMPVMDGIEATRHVVAGVAPARVLMLTTFDDDEYVFAALRAGASGFLVKDMALDDILAGIRVVAGGDALIAPSVTRRLIEQFVGPPEEPRAGPGGELRRETSGSTPRGSGSTARGSESTPRGSERGPELRVGPRRVVDGVTEREREVLTLVGLGRSNSEIAVALHISPATVKAHLSRLFTKLNARDRVHLVIMAYEMGLVSP